jgi:hypothetical protein
MRILILLFTISLTGCFGDCPDVGDQSINLNIYDETTGESICEGIVTSKQGEEQSIEFLMNESDCENFELSVEFEENEVTFISVSSEGYEEWSTELDEFENPNKCERAQTIDIPLKREF